MREDQDHGGQAEFAEFTGGQRLDTVMHTLHGLVRVALVAATVISGSGRLQAQVFDDFSDLNDTVNPTWIHLSRYLNSLGQTWDASTGQYHMTAPNNGVNRYGFVGSYVGNTSSDVLVTSDVVSFVDTLITPSGPLYGAVFGVAARLNGSNALAGLTGYAYLYEPFNGEMTLSRIGPGLAVVDLGNPAGAENVDWKRKVKLEPSKDYKFILNITGTQLHGEVWEVGGPLVAFQTNSDPSYGSGYSGYIAYSQGPSTGNPQGFAPVDMTWDNFSALPPVPGDFNNDMHVDAADYVVWRDNGGTTEQYTDWTAHFGAGSGPPVPGDFNNDIHVDAADYVLWRNGDSPDSTQAGYNLWKANFGKTAGSGAALSVIPEPSTLLLTVAALAALSTRRKQFRL